MVTAQRPEGMSPARLAAVTAALGSQAGEALVGSLAGAPIPHPPVTPISARARQIAAHGPLSAEQAQAGLDKGWLR